MKNIFISHKFLIVGAVVILGVITTSTINTNLFTGDRETYHYDFSKTENFSSDYLKISFAYPASLVGKPINNGVVKNENEEIVFFDKESIGDKELSEYWAPLTVPYVFSVSVIYEKFDPNNTIRTFYEEYGVTDTDFNEVPSLFLIKKAGATSPPAIFNIKIKDIQQITIGNNDYYTYSFVRNKERTDVFVISRENDYLMFSFYNQDKTFIEKILSLVKHL